MREKLTSIFFESMLFWALVRTKCISKPVEPYTLFFLTVMVIPEEGLSVIKNIAQGAHPYLVHLVHMPS